MKTCLSARQGIALMMAFILIVSAALFVYSHEPNASLETRIFALADTEENTQPQRDTEYLQFTVFGDIYAEHTAQIQRDDPAEINIGDIIYGQITPYATPQYPNRAKVSFAVPSYLIQDRDRIFIEMIYLDEVVSEGFFDVFVYHVTFESHGGTAVPSQRILGVGGFQLYSETVTPPANPSPVYADVTVSWNKVNSANTAGNNTARITITTPEGNVNIVYVANGNTIAVEVGSEIVIEPVITTVVAGAGGHGEPAFRMMAFYVDGERTPLARLENDIIIEYPGTGVISHTLTDDGLVVEYIVEAQLWFAVFQGIYFPGMGWIIIGEAPHSPVGPFINGQNIPPLIVPFSAGYSLLIEAEPGVFAIQTENGLVQVIVIVEEDIIFEAFEYGITSSNTSDLDDEPIESSYVIIDFTPVPLGVLTTNLNAVRTTAIAHDSVYRPTVLVNQPIIITRADFTFAGWYEAPYGEGNHWDFENRTIAEDITLHARWVAVHTDEPDSPSEPENRPPNLDPPPPSNGGENPQPSPPPNDLDDDEEEDDSEAAYPPNPEPPGEDDTSDPEPTMPAPPTMPTDPVTVTPTSPDTPPIPTVLGNVLVQEGDVWIEFDDMGVPLGSWSWDEDEEMWIFEDMPVPLGAAQAPPSLMPQTGLNNRISALIAGILGLTAFSVITLIYIYKLKKNFNLY
ncbi:MAG: InlB B-repeat-containing protein [Defluviitaleaceae bacterium]|nr:InlB B-repeat-containing protein [Defluviitaleaceae bacterium]